MSNLLKTVAIVLLFIISVFLIKGIFYVIYVNGCSTHPITNPGPSVVINRKLLHIRSAITAYTEKYQKYPDKLSDLVPEYVPINKASLFFKGDISYSSLEDLKNSIDTKGLFLYFPTNPLNGNVIAMTRVVDGTHGSVLYTDGSVVMLPAAKYGLLLHLLSKERGGGPHD